MPDDPTPDAATAGSPVSPCLGICLMDPQTRMCRGCLRTIEEIALWYVANPAEQRALLDLLAARRAALKAWQ